MQRRAYLFLILAFLLFILTAINLKSSQAQSQNFAGVMPFYTTGGFLAFFDQKTGMVYLYDDNLTKCVAISELTELGAPMRRIDR